MFGDRIVDLHGDLKPRVHDRATPRGNLTFLYACLLIDRQIRSVRGNGT